MALLVVVGVGLGVIVALRALPDWMLAQAADGESAWRYAAAAVLILRLALEVLFWPVLALAPLLLSPILVVEECGAVRGLVEWWGMLRRHLGRIFLYEAIAAAILDRHRLGLEPGRRMRVRQMPTLSPRGGLPMRVL